MRGHTAKLTTFRDEAERSRHASVAAAAAATVLLLLLLNVLVNIVRLNVSQTNSLSTQLAIGEMTDAGESDVQQDNIDVLLWSLSAWHRQQQRYREWIARNRLEQKRLRATSKVLLNRRRHPEFIAV